MKKKLKAYKIVLLICTFLVLISFTAYAYFSYAFNDSLSFKISSLEGNITITGADNTEITTSDEFLYIDSYKEFLDSNNFTLLENIATKISLKIDFTNSFATRVKITTPFDSTSLPIGLIYLITTNEETLATVLANFSNATSITDLRQKVYTYNYNKLKGLYENELYQQTEAALASNNLVTTNMNINIYIWGDYYSLPGAAEEDLSTGLNGNTYYLNRTYQFPITVKIIQAKDQYGGGNVSYEKD